MTHLVVVGNGVAGVSAAIRVRELQPDWRITIVSGESTYHYSRPALMYVFMGHMRYADTKPFEDSFWVEQRLDLLRAWAVGIDVEKKTLALHGGGELAWDKLLLATGSQSNKFGWPGQDLDGVQSLYDLRDLRLLYDNTKTCKRAVIVGGGLIGIELAEMLHSRKIPVSFLVRETAYWDNILPTEEAEMISRLIRAEGFDLRLGVNLGEILDDGRGRVAGVTVKETGERIDCQLVGLTPGVRPNLDLVAESAIETGRGILVDASLRTGVPDVYAAGDCAEIVRPNDERNLLQQVWYTGKAQGRLVGEVIAGEERSYEAAIWFNSAKFLDLEYQTYGRVNLRVPDERNLYWEHASGLLAVRFVHVAGTLIGVNVMGTRWRHEVCEGWIRSEVSVEGALEQIEDANFDPEFTRRHGAAIRNSFREQMAS